MELSEKPWQESVKKAEHLLACGLDTIYLYSRTGNEPPWQIAETCEPGGSHRMDISTDVRFKGKHPSGITFHWSFEIEPHSANGKGSYQIDCEGIGLALAKLPKTAADQFRAYLLDCAEKVHAKGEEWQGIASKQFSDAQILRIIARK